MRNANGGAAWRAASVILAILMGLVAVRDVRAAGWASLAMGPNPGGRLGEDMPFQGDDVIRRAPAAMKERGKAPEPDDRANAKEKCDKPGSGEKACEPETKPAPPAKP